MASLGRINRLKINRKAPNGLYLDDNDGGEILLPNKYITSEMHLGEFTEVFVYLDGEERPVATTENPKAFVNEVAILQVVDLAPFGAFLDWGVTKQLFLPHSEQINRVNLGDEVLTYIYVDPFSNRLIGSNKIDNFIDNTDIICKEGDEVKIVPYAKTDLGYKCLINYQNIGIVYANEVYDKLLIGVERMAFIKKVREDKKIDVSLYQLGHEKLDGISQSLYDLLKTDAKVRNLNDKSDPAIIARFTGMSKKNFKKALGILYKARKIEISGNDEIRIV